MSFSCNLSSTLVKDIGPYGEHYWNGYGWKKSDDEEIFQEESTGEGRQGA